MELSHFVLIVGKSEKGTNVYVRSFSKEEYAKKYSDRYEEMHPDENVSYGCSEIDNVTFMDIATGENINYWGAMVDGKVTRLEHKYTTMPAKDCDFIQSNTKFDCIFIGVAEAGTDVTDDYIEKMYADYMIDKEKTGKKSQQEMIEEVEHEERKHAIDKVVNDQLDLMQKTDSPKNIMYYGEVDTEGTEVLNFKSHPTSIPTTSSITWKQKSFAGICDKDAVPNTLDILNLYNSRKDIEIDVPGGIGENKPVDTIKKMINDDEPKDVDDGDMDDEEFVPMHYTGYVSEDGSKIININMAPTYMIGYGPKWDGAHFDGVFEKFSTDEEVHKMILDSYKLQLANDTTIGQSVHDEKNNVYYDGYVSEDGLKVERVDKTPTDEHAYETKWSGRHFWGVCDPDINYIEWVNNLLIRYGQNHGHRTNIAYRGWLNKDRTKLEKFRIEVTTDELVKISWDENRFHGVCSALREAEYIQDNILTLYKWNTTSYDQLTVNEKKVVYDLDYAYMKSVLVIKGNPADAFSSTSNTKGLVQIYNFTNAEDAKAFVTRCDKLNKDWIIMPIVSSMNNPMAFDMINGKNIHYKGAIHNDMSGTKADYLDLFYTMSETDKFRYHLSEHGKKFDFYGVSEVSDKSSTDDIRRTITDHALSTIEKITIKDNFDKE